MQISDIIILAIVLGFGVYVMRDVGKSNTYKDNKSLGWLAHKIKNKSVTPRDVVDFYQQKLRLGQKLSQETVEQLVAQLIRLKAFPPAVLAWLTDPEDYNRETLTSVIDEYIAVRDQKLTDELAVNAYADGFLSQREALDNLPKYRYPKTFEMLALKPEEYEEIRETFQKEQKAGK